MSVLMIAEQPNMDKGTYASMLKRLMPLPRSANGFVSHTGGRVPPAGCASSRSGSPRRTNGSFFDENLKSKLPPGLVQ